METGILILAEHDNDTLSKSTAHVVAAAKKLPGKITLLVVGDHCETVAKQAAALKGVSSVWLAESPYFEHGLAENVAVAIAEIGHVFNYILAAASTYGKNSLPRVAALLGVAQISDVIKIEAEDVFVRPIYAGNVLSTIRSLDSIKVMTIRPTVFEAVAINAELVPIKRIVVGRDLQLSSFVKKSSEVLKRPELTAAKIIIAGGRGLKSAQGFKLLEAIADRLGAAVGASRAAVDAGYIANEYQIGQTGKVVAPDLYIAVGISGAIQHVAGMKDSKIIVAINQDPQAPIFEVSDYGLVGDLFQILPELNLELAIQED
jgi:electron transfer flavoprotein alpha subunit